MILWEHKIYHHYYIYHLFVKKDAKLNASNFVNEGESMADDGPAKGPYLSRWLHCNSKLLIAMNQIEFSVQGLKATKPHQALLIFLKC